MTGPVHEVAPYYPPSPRGLRSFGEWSAVGGGQKAVDGGQKAVEEADTVRYYTWGRDLSGSLQGAGGVGGLLAISEQSPADSSGPLEGDNSARSIEHRFPAYDANGNIGQLINADANVVAAYTYDPFGNVTEMAGAEAAENPWRFSTKPVEAGTGWLYYGYRWYDGELGRWASRDPIEESGGVNLYGFVGNETFQEYDILGLVVHTGISWPDTVPHGDGRSTCYFCEDTWVATLIDTMNSVRRCCGSTLQDAAGGQFSGCCEGQPYSGDSSCCEGGMLLPKDKQYWEGKYESFDECVFQESASPHSLAGGFGGALVGGLVSLGNWGGVLGGTVAGVYGTAAVRCGLFICDNESE